MAGSSYGVVGSEVSQTLLSFEYRNVMFGKLALSCLQELAYMYTTPFFCKYQCAYYPASLFALVKVKCYLGLKYRFCRMRQRRGHWDL